MKPSALRRLALLALVITGLATRLPGQTPDDTVRVGDRILLRVDGEPQLSDTFTVSAGPALVLPVIGELAFKEVRRAEVERFLTRELDGFLKQPVVHARVLVRLGILGEVERPGYYAVPADAVLTQAIMTAGGPTRDAKVSQIRIERDHASVWSGDALQQRITQGLTVDQMRLRSGDQVVVPRRRDALAVVQVIGVLLTVPATIYALTRVF